MDRNIWATALSKGSKFTLDQNLQNSKQENMPKNVATECSVVEDDLGNEEEMGEGARGGG